MNLSVANVNVNVLCFRHCFRLSSFLCYESVNSIFRRTQSNIIYIFMNNTADKVI